MMKRCPDCGLTMQIERFPRNRSAPGGYGTYCKPCHSARGAKSVARNGGSRRYHLRRRYGIEPWEFDALVEKQGGVCAICREKVPTHLDHCHESGLCRGALCVSCNNGLGLFKDRADWLLQAARYLEASGQ